MPIEKGWVDDVVSEVISFPKAPHDDYTDTVSQAILWMKDNYMIDNDGYSNHTEDDEADYYKERKTYWSSLVGS